MKYYIIVGEASGDLHASNMMRSLKLQDPAAEFRFWGGDLMLAQGGTMVKHYKELSYMGFVEILMNLTTILGNVKFCKEDITDYVPDVLIFVDYSGFNLRIAKWAKQQGYKTNYYISPQVWASRAKRVIDIKRDIDNMFVILPFEKDFYEKYDAPREANWTSMLNCRNTMPGNKHRGIGQRMGQIHKDTDSSKEPSPNHFSLLYFDIYHKYRKLSKHYNFL